MNGMKHTSYNVSFVLHEALLIAPMVGCTMFALVWHQQFHKENKVMHDYFVQALVKLNIGLVLFVAGITAYCILISKAF